MAKWARMDGNVVAELTLDDPTGKFHPDVIWVRCPNATRVGWLKDGENFTPPVIPLAQLKALMKDAIKGREAQKSGRKIEHPNIAGSFFEPSSRIDRVLARCEGMANTDPLPVGGGAFDDINENPVPMTVRQLKNLRDAIVDREYANYLNRKDHIKSMMLQADPLAYDYSGGWS